MIGKLDDSSLLDIPTVDSTDTKDDDKSGKLDDGTFLDTPTVVNILLTSTDYLDSVPMGTKTNIYFLLNSKTNRRTKHMTTVFSDDCGVWASNSGSSPKATYLITNNGHDLKKICTKTING
ncbi:hypothetical protein KP79_PYT25525 [Mizuhopecten yessoensis]|uniref:Uncharacterized protein n=1 Tax=Mizuhopecten yessoensis TaxID=6573 RepID=A0A210QUV9_MIZYE|nr:hypothetical protein KP79_PYT25525 [Mizuhopecten yessoensis]